MSRRTRCGGIDRAAADFRELGERAAKRGMRVGFEALAWGRHINDYRDSWEVVRRADHPAVGLVLDSFHIFSRKTDIKPMRSIPADRIFLVQLADAPWLDMDVLSWSRHFRCFPGQGDMPLVEFMEALLATGYDGELSLEIFNDEFRAGSPRSVAVDAQRSLVYLMDQVREKTGKAVPGFPAMPPRSKCLGIEFIEFAVDDRTADELAHVLRPGSVSSMPASTSRRRCRAGRKATSICHQQGKGRLRPFALHHARAVGLRHRAQGR